MTIYYKIIILALIGSMIGYITNKIAVKMLFRPFKAINILGFKILGLIPKRRFDISKSVGEIIENELISTSILTGEVFGDDRIKNISISIKDKLIEIIKEKIPPMFTSMVDGLLKDIEPEILKHGNIIINKIIKDSKKNSNINISKIVEERINGFDLEKLEKIILSIASKELKHIELLGGFLGFIIGFAQGLIAVFF